MSSKREHTWILFEHTSKDNSELLLIISQIMSVGKYSNDCGSIFSIVAFFFRIISILETMAQTLTGIVDTDYEILIKLDPTTLFAMCAVNTYTQQLCNNQTFWHQKLIRDFPAEVLAYIPNQANFKDVYFNLAYPDPLKAAENGHVYVLELLRQQGPLNTGGIYGISDYALRNNQVNVLQWLYDHNLLFRIHPAGGAVFSGKTEALQWLEDHGFEINPILAVIAAELYYPKILNWLAHRGIYPTPLIDEIPEDLRTRQRLPHTYEEIKLMLPFVHDNSRRNIRVGYFPAELSQIARNLGIDDTGDESQLVERLYDYIEFTQYL